MRRYGIGLVMLAVATLTAVLAAQDAEPKRYALVVGINHYAHDDLDDLRFCENDAKELAKRFTDAKYDEVVLIRGKEATRDKILSELKRLVGQHKENDTLVVSLTGHGIHFKDAMGADKGSHFCPYDAIPKFKNREETLISMGNIYEQFGEAKRGPKMLFVDACRNYVSKQEGIVSSLAPSPPMGVLTYFSCSQGQFSFESHKLKHGLFTYALLEALDGKGGVNEDGEVTWATLLGYVPKRVAKLAKDAESEKKFIQEPATQTTLQGSGPVLLKLDPALLMPMKQVVDLHEPVAGEERSIEIADGVKLVMCYIPKGKATLGSPANEKARRVDEVVHEYESKGYWLGKYEVTQDQWEAVMKNNPSHFRAGGKGEGKVAGMQTGSHPVERVSWDACQGFLSKVNGQVEVSKVLGGRKALRLPHEDEWEFAYRGGMGNGRAFYWGDALSGDKANHDANYPYGVSEAGPCLRRTSPAGDYEGKAKHPWGLCDMSGNVMEWCDNWYDSEQKFRSVRGGSWGHSGTFCRGAIRDLWAPALGHGLLGFRILAPLN